MAPAVMTRRMGKPLIGILFVAFAVRLAFGTLYWVGKPLMLDEQEYLLLATSVATAHAFIYPPPPAGTPARHFERPPGFALFLAGVLKVTDDPLVSSSGAPFPRSSSDVPVSIKVAQSLAGALGVLIIAAIAAAAAGRRAGLVAGAIAAIYPPLAWMCGYVLAEPLYSALALATVWLLLRLSTEGRGHGFGQACAAGIIAGAALLTKEAMLFFLVLAGPWLVFRRQTLAAVGLVIGALVVVAPWVARNHAVYGRFVLTASHGGVTLWTGNNPLARGEGDLAANPDMGRARVAFEDAHPGLNNQELDDLYYREVIRFVRSNPLGWLRLEARKFFYVFVPIGPSYRLHSARYYVTSLVSYALLMPIALAGLVQMMRSGEAGRLWALWLMGASVVLTSVLFFPQERFRIPVLDPVAIVAAATFMRRATDS